MGHRIIGFILKATRSKARHREGLSDRASVSSLPLWEDLCIVSPPPPPPHSLPNQGSAAPSGPQPEVGLPSCGQRGQYREATELERDPSQPLAAPHLLWAPEENRCPLLEAVTPELYNPTPHLAHSRCSIIM